MLTLLLEDDPVMADHVRRGLQDRGHEVELVGDGRRGMIRAAEGRFDVAVVDRLLPTMDGVAIVRALRAAGLQTPVILLTALGGVSDRVEGLRAGADDYLVKPFDLDELDARMQALGRRPPMPEPTVVKQGGFELDRLRRRVRINDVEIFLTTSEFAILEVLMVNASHVVTKAMLLERVFDLDSSAPGMVIEPHVSRLRAKITALGGADPIRTLRGRGYSFHAD